MAEVASAFVSLVPSAKGFGGKISSQIGGDLDSAGKSGGKRLGAGISGGFLPSIKGLMGPVAALFAVGAITSFFKSANAEARESQKVGALTTNVIKTTGGVAKITAGQVGDLSMAISNKTGIDDEAIQHGANLLLTFKNVRNEVGKGSQIFNRATAAAADLSASGFGDLAGSSKMLGKALNDPMKGITALGRAGVTFSAGQKKQIEGFIKVGDLLGAQKIIMAEVESQVGGAAAASATAGEKAAVAFANLKEQIGTAMLPIIDKVANVFTTKVVPAISGFVTGMQNGTGAGGVFVGFLQGIWAVIQPIGAFIMGTVVPAVQAFFASFQTGGGPGAITSAFAGLVAFFQTSVVPAFMGIVTAVQAFVAVALPIVQAFIAGIMARIQPMLPTIMTIFATIGSIVTAAMGLIQAVVQRVTTVMLFIWTTWGGSIMSFITGVWSKILVIVQAALTVIQGVIKTVTSVIKGDWSGAWNGIKQIVSGAWGLIKGIISAALNVIGGIMSAGWALMKLGVSTGWNAIMAYIRTIPGKISSALGNLGGLLRAAGVAIITGFFDGLKAGFEPVKTWVVGVATWIDEHKGPLAFDRRLLTPHGRAIMDGLHDGLKSGFEKVKKLVTGMADQIAAKLDAAKGKLADALTVRNDFAKSIKESVIGLSSVVGVQAGESGTLTATDIVTQLKERLAAVKSFINNLARLKASGLNKTAYEQLVSGGVESGGAAAAAIVAGGGGTVKSINILQGQIAQQGAALGAVTSKTLFQAGVDSAQGLLNGLQSQASALAAAASGLGKALVAAIKKTLGIHSPSTVFRDLGLNIGAGLAMGVDASRPDVAASLRSLVSVPSSPSLSSVSGGGGALSVEVPVVLDGQVVGRASRTFSIEEARRNGKSGFAA